MRRLLTFFVIATAVAFAIVKSILPLGAVSRNVVISQVYGGGGNSGATFKNDFIELFNRGSVAVSLNGWSVQYASATGTTWQVTALSNVTLQPGQYYLVQEAAGSGGTVNLPTPDATGTIAMALGAGKVALVTSTGALSGSCPTSVVDFVGFGSTTNCFEGSGPTPTLSNTTAGFRSANGCTDTDSNALDFTTAAPNPRNTASATVSCPAPIPTNLSLAGSANPGTVAQGQQTLLTVTVT